MSIRNDLLREIDAYIAACKCAGGDRPYSETRFGLDAVKDGSFVPNLRDGRNITIDTADRIRRHIADNPPARQVAA